jgi:pectate lyase
VDITRGSDLVTVSWNAFVEHDKTMLIGATDNPTTDVGKLRVSVHHNLFAGIGQRAPRVRFGEVHVYNNIYDIVNSSTYVYSWGVGVDSKIFAENNIVLTSDVPPDQVIRTFNGAALHESGTLFGSPSDLKPVDLVAAYNATHTAGLGADVGWAPTNSIVTRLDAPSAAVVALVRNDSGPISH